MKKEECTVKHTTQYHLKQMDKIGKTGIVPDEYKKYFKGTKNPKAHINAINSTIEKLDKQYHKEHKKGGVAFDNRCELCKNEGESLNEISGENEPIQTIEKDDINADSLDTAKNIMEKKQMLPPRISEETEEKSTKVTTVEKKEKEEPDSEIGDIDIVIEENGKQKLYKLKEFRKKHNIGQETGTNEG